MPGDETISRVTDLSRDLIAELLIESEASGYRFLRRVNDEWASGANRFTQPGEALLGAEIGGRLVGICGLNVDPYLTDPRVGRVRNVYVLAAYRGRGIGRRLVEQAISMARGHFDRLRLRGEEAGPARLYESLGFRRCSGVPNCTHVLDLVEGCEADRIIGIYQRHAADWDRDRGRDLFEKAWLDRFTSLLTPRAPVLDLGCGSGEPIARYLIEKGCDVTGVDSSPALIDLCRGRFPHLNWVVADMRSLSLARRFDGILAWNSSFHLSPDDQRRLFPVIAKHAAPRAALMFTTGPSHGEAIGNYKGEPLYHGSLDGAEYRTLLGKNGFEVMEHAVEDPDCGGHTIWLARRIG